MDKNTLVELDNLPEEDRQRLSAISDQLQIRDSLRMYNSLVEECFMECINTFYRKSLTKQEETCVNRCAQKYLRLSTQVGLRFSDINQGVPTTDKGVSE